MRIKFVILSYIILVFLPSIARSQNTIRGSVVDSLSFDTIESGVIAFYTNNDSLVIKGSVKKNGSFNLSVAERVKSGVLKISCLNYSNKVLSVKINSSLIDVGVIKLKQNVINLKEVNIVSHNPPILLKEIKDTLEADFSGQYFEKYLMTGNALEVIPGIKMVGSKLFFNGEEIGDIKVGEKEFLFDNDFLMQNLPGRTIKKVQIISKTDKYGKKNKRLNIVLKDKDKHAYIYDLVISGGTKSSNFNALTVSRMDSLFQIGIRAQSNNLNQISSVWDFRALNRVNNIFGLSKITNLEMPGIFEIDKKTTLNLRYLYTDQSLSNEQESLIVDLTSPDHNKSNLNSISNFTRRSNLLKVKLRTKVDSVTNISFDTNGEFFRNVSENSIQYIADNVTSDSTPFHNIITFKGSKIGLGLSFDKLKKETKETIYSIELNGGLDRGVNGSNFSNNIVKDSITNLEVKKSHLGLSSRVNLIFKKSYSLQTYLINNFDTQYGNELNAKNNRNDFGIKYSLDKKKDVLAIDAAIFESSLRFNGSRYYNLSGFLSNVNFTHSFNNDKKLYVNFVNDYNLPTITQITGIVPFGVQQLLYVQPNRELKPERNFNGSVAYGYRDLLKLELGASYALGKIESIIRNNFDEEPVIRYFNSGAAKSVYMDMSFNKYLFQNKIYLANSLRMNYNTSTYSPNGDNLVKNNVFLLYNNLTFKYDLARKIKVSYSMLSSMLKYIDDRNLKNLTWSNKLGFEYIIGDVCQLQCDSQFILNSNSLQTNNTVKNVNVFLSRKVLKYKNLTLWCEANNIFNSKIGQMIYVDLAKIQYSNTSNFGRYFLFGINYKMNTFK